MSLDNLSIQIITTGIADELIGSGFGKPLLITPTDFAFPYSRPQEDGTYHHGTFIFSLNPTSPFITYSFERYQKIDSNTPFFNSLKKLTGAHVTGVEKLEGERIVTLSFESNRNDLDETNTGYDLIIELFPNHPNAYLVAHPSDKIIGLYKEKTNIAKNIFLIRNATYSYPPARHIDITEIDDIEQTKDFLSNSCYKRLQESCKDKPLSEELNKMFSSDTLYVDGKEILPYDFGDPSLQVLKIQDMYSHLVEDQREQAKLSRIKELVTLIEKSIRVSKKKQANLKKDLASAQDHMKYLEYGQIIYQYQDEIKRGDKIIERDGYSIPLDPRLTVSQNANQYFKRYQKAKAAINILGDLIIRAQDESEYLENKLREVKDGTPRDILELKSELLHEGYIKEKQGKRTIKDVDKRKSYEPHYLLLDGGKIGYGMNGLQNETLTFKIAHNDDIFLHVKDHPGSHVVILEGADKEEVFEIALELTLYLSHLDDGTVLVARRKDVKKNPERIGLVNILRYETREVRNIREESEELFYKELKVRR